MGYQPDAGEGITDDKKKIYFLTICLLFLLVLPSTAYSDNVTFKFDSGTTWYVFTFTPPMQVYAYGLNSTVNYPLVDVQLYATDNLNYFLFSSNQTDIKLTAHVEEQRIVFCPAGYTYYYANFTNFTDPAADLTITFYSVNASSATGSGIQVVQTSNPRTISPFMIVAGLIGIFGAFFAGLIWSGKIKRH